MSDGWKPLEKPQRGAEPKPKKARAWAKQPMRTEGGSFVIAPFMRLVRVHAFAGLAGGLIWIAMADSLFLSVDPSAARWRVGLYLLFTMMPFLVVSPLIGPALDRAKGGRRLMVVSMMAASAVIALFMSGSLDSLWLFPMAFAMLVLQKGYAIAKSALVPSVSSDPEELVDMNSKLTIIGGIATAVGGAFGAAFSWMAGAGLSVLAAMVAYGVCTIFALRLPKTSVAPEAEQAEERQELQARGIRLAATGIGFLRGIEGFLFFLIVFAFRGGTDGVDLSGIGSGMGARVASELGFESGADTGISVVKLGMALGALGVGKWAGALLAPKLREMTHEENIILGALGSTAVAGLLSLWSGGLRGAILLSFIAGLALVAAKLSFDSLVQRDAPDANYGRTFARFETRFQLLWVVGAIIPVALTLPERLGFFLILITAGFAAFSYFVGSRAPEPGDEPMVVAPPAAQPLGNHDETAVQQLPSDVDLTVSENDATRVMATPAPGGSRTRRSKSNEPPQPSLFDASDQPAPTEPPTTHNAPQAAEPAAPTTPTSKPGPGWDPPQGPPAGSA